MRSFLIKFLISLSQLLWFLPGGIPTYFIATALERRGFFSEGYDFKKLIVIFISWAVFSTPLYQLWKFLMKKTGITESSEYKALAGGNKKN